jgi:hypothetical protein
MKDERKGEAVKIFIQVVLTVVLIATANAAEVKNAQIGEVLGKPVYQSQLTDSSLYLQLHKLFTRPLLKQYHDLHGDELTVTEKEVEQFTRFYTRKHKEEMQEREDEIYDKIKTLKGKLNSGAKSSEERRDIEFEIEILEMELEPPDRHLAMFVLPHRKFQLHLYTNFGGGKLLWQQRGIEAFDAMHNWLLQSEEEGDFKIMDPGLREVFYSYWTTMDHGPFLIEDQTRIENEFLHPEWVR